MDKGKALDTRFEQIDALNAKIMSLKMILKNLNDRLKSALEEKNKELVKELKSKIEKIKRQIKCYMDVIKTLNDEIRNNWRQPIIKEDKLIDEEPEEKKIVETPEIRWYNFIQRFKRWRDNRNQKLLGEGQVTETQTQEKHTLRDTIRVANGSPSTQQGMEQQKLNPENVNTKIAKETVEEPGEEPGDEKDL